MFVKTLEGRLWSIEMIPYTINVSYINLSEQIKIEMFGFNVAHCNYKDRCKHPYFYHKFRNQTGSVWLPGSHWPTTNFEKMFIQETDISNMDELLINF